MLNCSCNFELLELLGRILVSHVCTSVGPPLITTLATHSDELSAFIELQSETQVSCIEPSPETEGADRITDLFIIKTGAGVHQWFLMGLVCRTKHANKVLSFICVYLWFSSVSQLQTKSSSKASLY